MSAKSLNRYTPVPPISSDQPPDKKTMSSSETKTKPSQSSQVNVSGNASVVVSEPPIINSESCVTTDTTATGGTNDSKANCSQVEAQCNGELSRATADDELVRSQVENSVVPEDNVASSTVNENDADNDDSDDDDDDDQSDSGESSTSVSFILLLYCYS